MNENEIKVFNGAILGQRTDLDFQVLRGNVLSSLAIEKYDTLKVPTVTQIPSVPPVSPKGIRIENAIIEGALDLEDCEINFPLSFHNCVFGTEESPTSSIVLTDSKVQSLVFKDCKIFGGIAARRIRTTGNFRVQGCEVYGAIELIGASIGRNLTFGKTDAGSASKIFNQGKAALLADRVTIGSTFGVKKAEFLGKVSLMGASIEADMNAVKAIFSNQGDVAIAGYRLSVGGDLALIKSNVIGQLNFRGATVGGDFDANSANFSHEGGVALRASRIKIGSNFCLGKGAKVKGCTRITGAKIGGQAFFDGSILDASEGQLWALFASGCKIQGSAYLHGDFQAISGVDFDNVVIRGKLVLRGGAFRNAPNLKSRILAEGDLVQIMPDVQTADYESIKLEQDERTAVSLVRATIGHLVMPDTKPEGIVNLARSHANIFEDFYKSWPMRQDEYDYHVLDGFTYDYLKNPNGEEQPLDEGKRKKRPTVNAGKRRLIWLEAQSRCDLEQSFKPNPWIQLKKVLKTQGRFDSAEEIGIQLRRHRRKTYPILSYRRFQDKILDFTSSYGTKPWETVIQMLVMVFLFAGVWWAASFGCTQSNCFDETVFSRSALDGYDITGEKKGKISYPEFNALAYSFDVFVPLADFKYDQAWTVNTAYHPLKEYDFGDYGKVKLTVGQLLYFLYLFEVLLGIVLTGLAIIGFTGYLSRDEQ